MVAPAPLSEIAAVTIEVQSAIQSSQAFGIPMIIDSEYTYGATARVLTVSTLKEMLDAGYFAYDRAYQMAKTMFSQKRRPKKIKIGQWNDGGETITAAWDAIVADDPEFYWVCMTSRAEADINLLAASVEAASQEYFYYAETADAGALAKTVGNVLLDLKNSGKDNTRCLYNLGTVQVSTLVFTGTITGGTFTGSIDGTAISEAFDTDHDTTVGNIATAIAAIAGVTSAVASDTDASGTDDTITITSAHQLNANVLTVSGDLTGATAAWQVTTAAQEPADAALIGYLSPFDPGVKIEAFAPIKGPIAASLTATQRTNLIDQNAGFVVQYGQLGATMGGGQNYGKVASGDYYADLKIGVDWLTLEVQTAVVGKLASGDVVPYTQDGIEEIKQTVGGALAVGVQRGFLAPTGDTADGDLGTIGYTVSAPAIGDISAANKAARALPDVTFQAKARGAIQHVTIEGSLSL